MTISTETVKGPVKVIKSSSHREKNKKSKWARSAQQLVAEIVR